MKRFFHFCCFILNCLLLFILYPFSKLFLSRKKIWLISERKNEAKDNGFSFFEYLCTERKNINSFFIIDRQSNDYHKVSAIGKTIRPGSLKHFVFFCAAKYIIATDIQSFCPNYYITLLRNRIRLPGKYIFLQHGVTYNNQPSLYKINAKINVFICACKPEKQYVIEQFGYSENEAILCGFARFDNYFFKNNHTKTILIMPTWRRWISEDNLLDSMYYKKWISFLNSRDFNTLLEKNNIIAYFYAHPLFQKYVRTFSSKSRNIIIASKDDFNIQELLGTSNMLITDYSSVFFDYAYMRKPVIFYQFDFDQFYSSHYKKGYFDFRNNSFGPISYSENDLIKNINFFVKNGYNLNENTIATINSFFLDKDDKNSERIYEAIVSSTKYGKKYEN